MLSLIYITYIFRSHKNKENNVFKDALGVKGLGFKHHGNHPGSHGSHYGKSIFLHNIHPCRPGRWQGPPRQRGRGGGQGRCQERRGHVVGLLSFAG